MNKKRLQEEKKRRETNNGWGSMYKTSAFTYTKKEEPPTILKQIMQKAKDLLL